MKKLLVGVDFSKGSMNALSYAVMLANNLPAEILMVWVEKPMSPESIYANKPTVEKNEVIGRFEQIIKEYSNALKFGTLKYKICFGKVYEAIADQARQYQADYIVIGTHGISGYEELWIGSNANRIVAAAVCPVFTVRQNFSVKESISAIVLPIDHTSDTTEKVDHALKIASAFKAKIYVLGLYSSELSTLKRRVETNVKKAQNLIENHSTTHEVNFEKSQNLTSTTIKFAEKINADLICIMTEQETSTNNILLGQYAQQMVNHSHVPVLSVHPRGLYQIRNN